MPRYLFQAKYSAAGAKVLADEGGTARVEAAAHLAEGLGGRLEAFYFAFDRADTYLILDLPNETAAAAWAASVTPYGGVADSFMTALLTPEEVDSAVELAKGYIETLVDKGSENE